MGLRELTFRLVGICAICLAALAAPIPAAERVLLLTAYSLGVGCAAVLPGYDRPAARVVGPAVLLLAVGPATDLWAPVAVLCVLVVGFATFDDVGLSRAVPALGLPVLSLAFRTGHGVPGPVLGLWLAAVLATLVLGAGLSDRPALRVGDVPEGGDGPRPDLLPRTIRAVAAVTVVVPLALVVASQVTHRLPDLGPGRPQGGVADGAALAAHPGLSGGLDTGQPVELGDDEVLRVRSDQPAYWRGLAYDRWDGRRWTRTIEEQAIHWDDDGVSLSGDPTGGDAPGPPDLPDSISVDQEFEVARTGLDVVLGAWRPTALWSTARSGRMGEDGSIRLDQPLLAGATWSVTSSVVPAGPDDLRAADPLALAPDSEVVARYGSPSPISAEVADLAAAATAGAATTYDKVQALMAEIESRVTYTRDFEPLPPGADVVNHLLFVSRSGHCEQIGSALVVMLRSLGVPARLVVGYVPSSYDAGTGQWVSLASDAHAWAEVWFPGVGWVGFDPTAQVPLARDGGRPAGLPVAPVVVSVAVGAVVLVALVLLRRRRAGPGAGRPGTRRTIGPLMAAYDRCGGILGLTWPPTMTVRERAADLLDAGVDDEAVIRAVAVLEDLWYAAHGTDDGLDAGAFAEARQALEDLEQAVRAAVEATAAPA